MPTTLRSNAGFVLDRVRWRNRHDLPGDAADLLHQHPDKADGNVREWWRQRDDLARWALENGKARLAYDLASQHGFSSEKNRQQYAEAEWLSGWIALRALNQPKIAFQHFSNMAKASTAVVSKARYAYWAGRALDAQGDKEQAKALYKVAAQYGTTFYGQVAALDRYGDVQISVPANLPVGAEARQRFAKKDLVRLTRYTHQQGEADLTRKFFLALMETVSSQDEATLAAELATEIGRRDLAVWAGKIGGRQGFVVGRDSYPLLRGSLPAAPDKAYIHAIVRQESGFDPKAKSPAGALGLMQLMPATAASTAKKIGVTTSPDRLVSDPVHNVTLGSALLDTLLARYDESLILTAVGYNAGTGRISQWLDRFGDPRSPSPPVLSRMKGHNKEDPAHWIALDVIESYPFSETRFYIQQVIANAGIYRALLHGGKDGARLDIRRHLTGS